VWWLCSWLTREFQYAPYSIRMNIKISPSHITRHMMYSNNNVCFSYTWRHLCSGGKPSFKGHCQTTWSKKKNENNQRESFRHDEWLIRSAFFGHEKTWEGLTEVQKINAIEKVLGEWLHCLYHYRIVLDENKKVRKMVKKVFFFIPHHITEVTISKPEG